MVHFFFIVRWLKNCGLWFSVRLVFFWVMPYSILEMLSCWMGCFGKKWEDLESCSFAFNVFSLEREMIIALKERDEPNEVEDLIFEEFV